MSGLVRAVLVAAVLFGSLSGCAVAVRVLTAVEVVDAVHGLVEDAPTRPAPARTAPARTAPAEPVSAAELTAVVGGTRGKGLRLNARPGAQRVSALPDGSVVTVLCAAAGPQVAGPRGVSATWSYVRTATGETGYMSDAYLAVEPAGASAPPCD